MKISSKIPNKDSVRRFIASHPWVKNKVHEIASRLVALKEYNWDQAVFVAADIVRFRYGETIKEKLASLSLPT